MTDVRAPSLASSTRLVPDAVHPRSQSWIYFVNYLDPNGPSSTLFWPQYEQSNKTQIQFKLSQQSLIAVRLPFSFFDALEKKG